MPDEYCDDGALVVALRAGDERAFEWLLDRYDTSLHRVARTFVSSIAAVDEVVQDTWLGVIEGIDRFEQRSSVKTWIFHIMMNKAKTRGIRDKRTVPFSAMGDGGIGATIDPERFFAADHDEFPGHWASPPPAWENLPEARVSAGALTNACELRRRFAAGCRLRRRTRFACGGAPRRTSPLRGGVPATRAMAVLRRSGKSCERTADTPRAAVAHRARLACTRRRGAERTAGAGDGLEPHGAARSRRAPRSRRPGAARADDARYRLADRRDARRRADGR